MILDLKKKILIVDDDDHSAFVTEAVLEKHYKTTVVSNGYVAIKSLEMIKYDAVLMDINLNDPNMNGLKAMWHIKQSPKSKRVKVFALTAHADNREWYIKQGFDDLILKPLDEDKILNTINDKLSAYVNGSSLLKKPAA